jgi:hypothetical protein
MKKLFVCLTVIVSLFTVSCKKGNEAQPQSPATADKTINVEYRISSESGLVDVNYIVAKEDKFSTISEQVKGQYYTVNFTAKLGSFLSVDAGNQTISHRKVQVEIYIDGVKVKEGSSSSQARATASGVY